MNRRRRCYNLVTLKIVHSWSLPLGNAVILNHKCNRSVDRFCIINVLWLPLLKSSLINYVVSFSETVHQKCRSCPKQIRVKRKWQILASQNLPRLEGALFQGLGAWRIIFFYFRNHFLKIHTRGIPKMSDFYVFSHFWPRKWLLKLKKRVLTPSFSHLTFSSQMGTLSSIGWLGDWVIGEQEKVYKILEKSNLQIKHLFDKRRLLIFQLFLGYNCELISIYLDVNEKLAIYRGG